MDNQENQIYLQKIDEIADQVYELYNLSPRDDLVMVYNMLESRIYAYAYSDFLKTLNEKSRSILVSQYQEAKEENKIVLFIRDDIRKKFKSFTI